jgi:hypothetical protein
VLVSGLIVPCCSCSCCGNDDGNGAHVLGRCDFSQTATDSARSFFVSRSKRPWYVFSGCACCFGRYRKRACFPPSPVYAQSPAFIGSCHGHGDDTACLRGGRWSQVADAGIPMVSKPRETQTSICQTRYLLQYLTVAVLTVKVIQTPS